MASVVPSRNLVDGDRRSAVLDHFRTGGLGCDVGRKPGDPPLVCVGRLRVGSRELSKVDPSAGVEGTKTIVEGNDDFAEKCGKPIEKVRKIRYTLTYKM